MSSGADAEDVNKAQIAHWNLRGGSAWVPAQERLDQMLAPMGSEAIDAAELSPGQRVLDIGCGCGDTTLAAAARVGTDGHVVGLDVSAPMLARARERAQHLDQVVFVLADAQTTDIAALGVQRVISRFGVMFFSDPGAAFGNIRTALVPDGKLSLACWQTAPQNPWMGFAVREVADILEFPASNPAGPGPFSFGNSGEVKALLSRSGFVDTELTAMEGDLDIVGGASIEVAVENSIEMSPIGAMVEDDADLAERVRERLLTAFDSKWDSGSVTFPYACWIVTATNPAS